MRYAVVPGVLAASLIGCSPPQTPAAPKLDAAAAQAAVAPQLTRIGEMVARKDAAGIASMFTDDATWILPDASTFNGKPAIQSGAAAFFASFDSVTTPTESIDKLIVVSDSELVSFAIGKYTIYMKGKKTGEAHVNPFADYWKKGSDGSWRISYEVNAEGPAPAPPPAAAAKK